MKLLASLVSVLLLSSVAFADTSRSTHSEKPNGDYTDTDESTNAAGTTTKTENTKSTSKHWTDNGKTTTSKHVKTVDPKGLGNEQYEEDKEVSDQNADGSTSKHVTKKVNGRTVSEESSSATK